MITLNIHETKTHLSAILAKIEKDGEHAVICRHGKPVADIVPHVKKDRSALHSVMKKVAIHYDPKEPLSDDEWPEVHKDPCDRFIIAAASRLGLNIVTADRLFADCGMSILC